jgi:hypothetical protein
LEIFHRKPLDDKRNFAYFTYGQKKGGLCMSDHILKTLEQAKDELRKHEEAVMNTKRFINQLCAFGGMPPQFNDAELQTSTPGTSLGAITIRRNAFFGRPLATCVREYLEMRKDKPVKEATLVEIVDALKEGGFDLDKISEKADDAKRGVAITLAKNPQFYRLPNDDWGLLAWYPNVKRGKESKGNGDAAKDEAPSGDASLPPGVPKVFTTKGGPEEVQ